MIQKTPEPLVILRRKQLEARIGLSRSTIYDKLNPRSKNYDFSFPRMVSLGARCVGWYSHEIEVWLASRQRSSVDAITK